MTIYQDPQEFHLNALGTMQGGLLSTLLDTAIGCAVYSVLPVGVVSTSLDLNVKFLRPVTLSTGTLTCVGEVLQRARRTAPAEGRITDAAGRLFAHAMSTCIITEVAPSTGS